MGKSWLVAVLCAGLVAFAAGCAGESAEHKDHMRPMLSGILDGKTFVGEVGMGDTPAMGDTLTFKDGYFNSSSCEQYHFHSAAYLAVASGDTTTFECIAHNHKGAVNVWMGTVKGGKLEGAVTTYEEGKEPVKHWVRATLQ